jgi:hypothetical protein
MKEFYICGVEGLGYWMDERYLGCYSSWGLCEVGEVLCSLGVGVGGVESWARRYELRDWLRNVRVGVTDQRLPIYKGKKLVGYRAKVVEVRDYYRYGVMAAPSILIVTPSMARKTFGEKRW